MEILDESSGQMEDDDALIASEGGKMPIPYGFWVWVCMAGSVWLLIRISLGLPAVVAPIFELGIVSIVLRGIGLVSAIIFIGWRWALVIKEQKMRTSQWVLRYGKDRMRRIPPPGAMLIIVLIEGFFGLLYLLEWLWNRAT